MASGFILLVLSMISLLAVSSARFTLNETLGLCKSEVIFALDHSTSMTDTQFGMMKVFAQQITSFFSEETYGMNGTRVGALQFSTGVNVAFNLSTHTVRSDAEVALLAIPFLGGITNTHLALNTMNDMFQEARPELNKVAIVITDGNADDPDQTAASADVLKADDVVIVVIAVGTNINRTQLLSVASPGSFVEVNTFAELQSVLPMVQTVACSGQCINKTVDLRQFSPTPATIPNLPAERADVAVDPINASPFAPVWTSVGCAENDTQIVGQTRTFADEAEAMLNVTTSISDQERDCYRVSINNLRTELSRILLDCPRISQLVQCGLKVLRLMNDQNVGNVIVDGTRLAGLWSGYANASFSTTDLSEARALITRQRSQEAALRQELANTADTGRRAALQAEIDRINNLVETGDLKVSYSEKLASLNNEFTQTTKDTLQIATLQGDIVNDLRDINSKTSNAQERTESQTALNAMETAVDLNGRHSNVVLQITQEEGKVSPDPAILLNLQRQALGILENMETAAPSQAVKTSIRQVITPLNATIANNDRIVAYLNTKQQLETAQTAVPAMINDIYSLQTQASGHLILIRNNTVDPAAKTVLQSVIDNLKPITDINEAKVSLDAIEREFTAASVPPINASNMTDILNRHVAQLRVLQPLSNNPIESADVATEITAIEEVLKKCFN